MCREGGRGVIMQMNPAGRGPYRPLYLWGLHVTGGISSRLKVTRLVRGTVKSETKVNFSTHRLHV